MAIGHYLDMTVLEKICDRNSDARLSSLLNNSREIEKIDPY